MKTILVLLLVFLTVGVYSQDYSVGYKDIAWATLLEDMPDQFTPSDNKIPPLKGYDRVGEDFSFEDFTAELVTYGFKKGKFKGVNILIKNDKLEHLVQLWTERYGDPKFTDAGFLKNYEWHMDTFRLTISNFPQKSGDANTTIGISMK